jgi:aryl-alcohol dehydrogenase-like predicted oxidoreductase
VEAAWVTRPDASARGSKPTSPRDWFPATVSRGTTRHADERRNGRDRSRPHRIENRKGNWQLSARHGATYDRDHAIEEMRKFVDAGITLFDCADHYVGVEELIGDFRRRYPQHAKRIAISTKLVPDLETLASVSKADVEAIVDTSLERLGQEALDLVQFHWWEYEIPAGSKRSAGSPSCAARARSAISARPISTPRTCAKSWRPAYRSLPTSSSGSVFDRRPERGLADFCRTHGVALLCYGTIAGGFISERWLGAADPAPPLANRSLVKYRLILEDFGGWNAFQRALETLVAIGRKHGVAASSVAIRYVLDQPGATVAIVGAQDAARLAATLEPFTFALDDEDRAQIAARTAGAQGPSGDCYARERDRESEHYKIMWPQPEPIGGTDSMSDAFADEFELYDLRVEVLDTGKPFVSHARVGDTFEVIGGRIVFPQGREASFSLYAMMAVLPFLPRSSARRIRTTG